MGTTVGAAAKQREMYETTDGVMGIQSEGLLTGKRMAKKSSDNEGASANQSSGHQPFDGDQSDRYFDLSGLAHYTSLSVRSLRNYLSLSADPIPSYQLDKKILVRRSEFDAWINRRKRSVSTVSRLVDDVLSDLRKKL